MIKKCHGCGIVLQDKDVDQSGYVVNLNHDHCTRCFKIKHYGEYKEVIKTNDDFMNVLQLINKTDSLVLLVIDLFNIPENLDIITQNLKNDKLLVINKRDLFATDIYDLKFINYIRGNYIDKVLVSSNNNYNFDLLYELILKYKKKKEVYVVGFTNAGKSTMINKIIYNYSNNKFEITTSVLPSTTLDTINIMINDELTIIDTPGLIEEGNANNLLSGNQLKKVLPSTLIKPITYQIKEHQFINISNLISIESSNNDLTIFASNKLRVERTRNLINKDLVRHELMANNGLDIVISGIAFIKVKKEEKIIIYTLEGVKVYIRESLI